MKRISYFKTKIFVTVLYIALVLAFSKLGFSCVFREYLGIVCPGCGMTRAFSSLIKLDIVSAFKYHPMFWSVPIVYIYILFDHPIFTKIIDRLILSIILIGFCVNWLYRIM